ncbi:hypothetical protein DL769_002663 [Monosporascus sp. CRB-8-3]|nr:hypothetical protein DL769_002663 [Monosporascus sp. CRB-8-3]
MENHKSSYDSPSEAPVAKEAIQGLVDDVVTSHTHNLDEETATEQQYVSGDRHPVEAAAATATRTEHETALSREVEAILRGLIDEAIASAYENEGEEPAPGDGGGRQQSALAALLARLTPGKRGGGNRAAPPPAVIVISSDEEDGSSGDDEPFPRYLMRRSGKRSRVSVPLPASPTTATDTSGGSGGLRSPSSARSSGASTSGSGPSASIDAGRQESIVTKIQRRPAVEFPRHAYSRRQKRRYETSSPDDDDEGADRAGRRRKSGRAGDQAETFIDLTLDSEPEEPPRAEASSSAAAPDQPWKKKRKHQQKQKYEGNDQQKRGSGPPAGKRNRIGQMAAAAAAARSGKRWRY